jgi:hypothetical protein
VRIPAAAPFALVLLCAACRSDGGFGRKDSERDLRFSTQSVVRQTEEDARTITRTIGNVPQKLSESVADSWRSMRRTWDLYFENHEDER